MKKILLLVLAFSLISTLSFSQSSFGFVEKFGFDGQNGSVTTMASFKGKLYAGMGEFSAPIFSSTNGDPNSFSNVYDPMLHHKVSNFCVTTDGLGYIYAGLIGGASMPQRLINNNQVQATPASKVVRSIDGVTWEDYYELPFGSMDQLEIRAINVFNGTGAIDSVYIAYTDDNGYSHIVRNAIDANDFVNSATWQEVANFNTLFGSTSNITSSVVYAGKLIYSTSDNRLFETADGINYTENTSFYNSMGPGSTMLNNYK